MNADYSKIGKSIKRRREKLRLTQAVLAERCEITEQYVSNIERAISIPSTEVIMKLALDLGGGATASLSTNCTSSNASSGSGSGGV